MHLYPKFPNLTMKDNRILLLRRRPDHQLIGNADMQEKPKRGKWKAAGREGHHAGGIEVDEKAPSKPSNCRASARKASGSKLIDNAGIKVIETLSDGDEDEEVKPTHKECKTKISTPRKPLKKAVPPVPINESNDDAVELPLPPRSKSTSSKLQESQKASGKAAAESAGEEEEKSSLFEPPPP